MHLQSSALCLLAALALGTTALAAPGDLIVVAPAGQGDFDQIQPAVDLATDGDTIIVLPGGYNGFSVSSKTLSILGDTAQFVRINGPVSIDQLAVNQNVNIAAMDFKEGLEVTDCVGFVQFSDCHLLGNGLNTSWYEGDAQLGMQRILHSENVLFSRSILRGRAGDTIHYCGDIYDGIEGESALYVEGSRVGLYSCDVEGGKGGPAADGACLFFDYGYPADGGAGIYALDAEVYVDNTQPLGGEKGEYSEWLNPGTNVNYDGPPVELQGTAQVELATDPVLTLDVQSIVRENAPLPLVIGGPVGAQTWILWTESPRWRPFGGDLGILHLGSQALHFEPVGFVPAGGVLNGSFVPPTLLPGEESRRLFLQAFAYSAPEGRLLGTPSSLDVIDAGF